MKTVKVLTVFCFKPILISYADCSCGTFFVSLKEIVFPFWNLLVLAKEQEEKTAVNLALFMVMFVMRKLVCAGSCAKMTVYGVNLMSLQSVGMHGRANCNRKCMCTHWQLAHSCSNSLNGQKKKCSKRNYRKK